MKIILTLFFFGFVTPCLWGQIIHGRVFDSAGLPVNGAYIIHLSSGRHTHSNEMGNFSLQGAQSGDTLHVSHLGFETAKVVLNDLSSQLKIQLQQRVFQLNEILVGQNIKAVNLITNIDLLTSPVNSSQEILRKVPGLFIGQHAGGGKAEQIFLRGFDIDHGTDVNISVDGMPVNMVSHAHGQGYADMHFLIPETIDKIDFGKGPYYADKGNFTTAGYIEFQTKDRLENSSVSVEAGRFNTLRTVGLLDVVKSDNHNAYLAAEYLLTDGPFESSQNFHRLNLMGKYTAKLSNQDKLSVLASHFSSQWDASGQIPQRAVDAGIISRFGAIDDTEGGRTSRTNLALEFNKNIDNQTFIKNRIYYNLYDFELYSNFTFFLNDPENGDQIRQKEERRIFGMESVWNQSFFINSTAALLQGGVGLRFDEINGNELSRTLNRKTTLENLQLGNVREANLYTFLNAEFDIGKLLINPAVRLDYFKFNYVNNLDTTYQNQVESRLFAGPKLNLIYNYSNYAQFFLKTGTGFHSNDTRVVARREGRAILPAAYGADLGAIWKPAPRLVANTALWYLFLEQEFVYVGDAGIVEPSGRTRRLGVDVGIRHQLLDWLFTDVDVNYAFARSIDEPEGTQYIPLAPDLTATGGISIQKKNFSGGLRCRYLKDRPANEDNSIVAKGYFITDLNAGYTWKRLSLGFVIENLFDNEWNETQFATESRTKNEPDSVEEIHFTPGTPFFAKGSITYKF